MKGLSSLLLGAVAALSPISMAAQILFSSGSPYTQNFDWLANAGTNKWLDNFTLPGWYASQTAGGGVVTEYRAQVGTSTAGAFYSFGQAMSSERALGSIAAGGTGSFAYGVRFLNDTPEVITNLTITYTGEQWRNSGSANLQALAFGYRISAEPITSADAGNTAGWTGFSPLDFNSPVTGSPAGSLDGNFAANRQIFYSVRLPGVVVFPGEEIFFRWYDRDDSGYDHGLGIDDVTIAFAAVAPFTNPPAIDVGPESITNSAGTLASFTVGGSGTLLMYQWQKEGRDLADDGSKFAGCLTPMLLVSNVLAADAGAYTVVLANGGGSCTSAVATLTVLDPAIKTQPLGRTVVAGDNATLSVSAEGTRPLSYQWRLNGADLAGGTGTRLSFTGIAPKDQGLYVVVVSNSLGNAVTSAPALVTVLTTPATLLAEWDFNDTNSLITEMPAPSIGTGWAGLLATKAAFSSGSPADSAGTPGPNNSGWNISGFAGQGTSNKLTGVQFNASTAGYQDLLLAWDERHSNTASKYTRLQYSADGANFVDGPVLTMTATDNSYVCCSASLAGIAVLEDNPNFAFRIVAEFESTAVGTGNDTYAGTAGSYGTAGTVRFDLMRIFGNPLGTVTAIPLHFQLVGSDLVLTWSNPACSLAGSSNLRGEFTKIPGATSPYTNRVIGSQQFFRLISP